MNDTPDERPGKAETVKQDTSAGQPGYTPQEPTPPVQRSAPPSAFQAGDLMPGLSSWRLERRIGVGGFGEVWLARHELGRAEPRAVKFCTHPEARNKLATYEKTQIARVMRHTGNHPNVVPLLDHSTSGPTPWLMYEYVPGGTLADAILSWRELPLPRRLGRAAKTLLAIAGALARFHQLEPAVVHRDMKPQNVLMAGKVPRITDFGISRVAVEVLDAELSSRGFTEVDRAGSRLYAPTEQLLGSPPDPRDDVYALGIIAYQMVMADLRYTPGVDAEAQLRELKVPRDFIALVIRSVAQKPTTRPKHAGEWEQELAALIRKQTVTVSAPESLELPDIPAVPDRIPHPSAPTVHIAVKGTWLSRPSDAPTAVPTAVARTPAMVSLDPDEHFSLQVDPGVTDRDLAGVRALVGLASFRALVLSGCKQITDAGLEHVAALTELEHLDVGRCERVTDLGLWHLAGMTRLRHLYLVSCPRVTDAGIAQLQRVLPNCRVAR